MVVVVGISPRVAALKASALTLGWACGSQTFGLKGCAVIEIFSSNLTSFNTIY